MAMLRKKGIKEIYICGEFTSLHRKKKGLALREDVIKCCSQAEIPWTILPLDGRQLKKLLRLDGKPLLVGVAKESPLTVIAMTDVIVESPKTTFAFPPWFTPAMKRRERQRLRRLKKRVFRRDQINRAIQNGGPILSRFLRRLREQCAKCRVKIVPFPMAFCDICKRRFHKKCQAITISGGRRFCQNCKVLFESPGDADSIEVGDAVIDVVTGEETNAAGSENGKEEENKAVEDDVQEVVGRRRR